MHRYESKFSDLMVLSQPYKFSPSVVAIDKVVIVCVFRSIRYCSLLNL